MIELLDLDLFTSLPIQGWNQAAEPVEGVVLKARYQFDESGELKQVQAGEVVAADEFFDDDPETRSLCAANEAVTFKQGSEWYLYGSAYPAQPRGRVGEVKIIATANGESLQQHLLVTGPRVWQSGLLGSNLTEPNSFETVPLQYENAYGGGNVRSNGKPDYFELNPVGKGYIAKGDSAKEQPGPQIEVFGERITNTRQKAQRAGLAPLPMIWPPRSDDFQQANSDDALLGNCPFSANSALVRHNVAPLAQRWAKPLTGQLQLSLQGVLHWLQGQQMLTLKLDIPELAIELDDDEQSFEQQAQQTAAQQTSNKQLTLICDTLVINTNEQWLELVWRTSKPHNPLQPSVQYGKLIDLGESAMNSNQEANHG